MARAAVKAKQQAKKNAAPPAKPARSGRRGHAAGGNPNQQLFFIRLRRKAKPAYLVLAVLFGITFAFLGVGSGTNGGLDQLFSGLNFFSSSGTSVSKAQKEIKDHPNSGKGYRDLATAYEGKGDSVNAISALQQYTVQKPKDAAAWSELGGLQFTQAQNYLSAYQAASNARHSPTRTPSARTRRPRSSSRTTRTPGSSWRRAPSRRETRRPRSRGTSGI